MTGTNSWQKTVSTRNSPSLPPSLFSTCVCVGVVGFMLLGGRLRESHDQEVVLEAIVKQFKRDINPRLLFGLDGGEGGVATKLSLSSLRSSLPQEFSHLVWTDELLKMAVLVHRCLQFDEPVLLVGSTG